MLALRRLIILALAVFCAASFAAGKKRDRRLSEYVLTFDQFNNMDLPERVEYIKFLGRFLVVIEDAQKPPVGEKQDKKKTAQMMQRFFELAISRAYAQANYDKSGNGIAGQTCIHSFAVSEYIKNNKGKWVCKEPQTSSQCSSGQTGCGDQLYKAAKLLPGQQDLKGLCVPSDYKHRTANCWKQFNELGGKYTDQAIADRVADMYETPEEKRQFAEFSKQIKVTLEEFQNQSMGTGVSIREYCQLSGKERGKNSLNGGLQDEECKSIMKAVDTFATATKLPEKVNVDPAAIQPANADVDGQGNGEQDENVTVVNKNTTKEKSTETMPEPTNEYMAEPEPTPQAVEPEPAEQGNAGATDSTKTLGPLECVAKGLAQALGSNDTSYSNWVALMGVIVQKNSGNDRYTSAGDPIAYQSKVIDAIGSFGYCKDATYPIDVKGNGAINDWITGKKPPSTEGISTAFGITNKYSRNVINDLFALAPGTSLADRNINFKAKAGAYASTYGETPFSKCAGKMADLKDMRFNFVCNSATKTYSKTAVQKNTAFRNGLAAACKGVSEFKNPPAQSCEADSPEAEPAYEEPVAEPEAEPAPRKKKKKPVVKTKPKVKTSSKKTVRKVPYCRTASSVYDCRKINRGKNCYCMSDSGGRDKRSANPPSREGREKESDRGEGGEGQGDRGGSHEGAGSRGDGGGKDGGIR